MTRTEMLQAIKRYVADLDNPACYGDDGESRYLEFNSILDAIDWGHVPAEKMRALLRFIVRTVPVKFLTSMDGFGDTIVRATDSNTRCKRDAELEAKRAKARAA